MNDIKLILTLFLFSPVFSITAQSDNALSEERMKRIDSIFQFYDDKPGCAVAVVKESQILLKKGYGLANLAYNIPVDSKTIFDVGALSKQFTAACVFLLEQEGKLKLNDPIQKFLPEFPSYGGTPITVGHLIYDTSGLREYLATLHSKNIYWGDDYNNQDALKAITRHKGLNFPSGTKHGWGHTNYVLLASIIEKVSRKTLANYAQEKIFQPLGMKNSFFRDDKYLIVKNGATGYQNVDNEFKEFHYFNHSVVGSMGLRTNLEDFIRWSNNLKTGAVGGKQLVKRMTTPGKLLDGKEILYAGGLYYQNHYDIDGLPRIAHSGNWAGFQTLFYKFLDQDLAIIILSNNADTFVWGLLDQLAAEFIGAEIRHAQQAMEAANREEITPLSLSQSGKKKFSGTYYSTLNGNLREIKLEDGKLLYYRPGANPVPLVAIRPNVLIYENAPQVKFVFDEVSFDAMTSSVNDRDAMQYKKYNEHNYKPSDLKVFENSYYNEDLDQVFEIRAIDKELQMLVDGEEIIRFQPIDYDLFTSEHSGYIVFERNQQNSVIGFTRYDDILYNLKHQVI